MNQLPLPLKDDKPAIRMQYLSWGQSHFLFYILTKDGRMIPPEVCQTAVAELKGMGLIRDGLEAGYVELTPAGERVLDDWFEACINTGATWICKL